MTGRLFLRALLFVILAIALNVAVSFLWVWIYSVVIAPGHNEAFYQAYAGRAAPISSLIAGVPILFVAGWLSARGASPGRMPLAGALVGIIYAAIDLAILLSVPNTVSPALIAASLLSKIGAGWLGGHFARRRVRRFA